MRLGGIVLCGGQSSRMGRPKAWLPFGDEFLLQRVVRVLREAAEPVVVVAAPGQDVPPVPDAVEVIRDAIADRGPLQGLAAGLEALSERADTAYLSACDAPFLTAAFVRRIAERIGEASACVPRAGGFLHPLAAVYRLDILPEVHARLTTNRLGLSRLFDAISTRIIEPSEFADVDSTGQSLQNVNTLDDYRRAMADLIRPATHEGFPR